MKSLNNYDVKFTDFTIAVKASNCNEAIILAQSEAIKKGWNYTVMNIECVSADSQNKCDREDKSEFNFNSLEDSRHSNCENLQSYIYNRLKEYNVSCSGSFYYRVYAAVRLLIAVISHNTIKGSTLSNSQLIKAKSMVDGILPSREAK